ncbi:MAG: sugar transferase [Alphaproteobacteria bacterium]|nr:sugar transferase [Alphaproteobacteria bacterium]
MQRLGWFGALAVVTDGCWLALCAAVAAPLAEWAPLLEDVPPAAWPGSLPAALVLAWLGLLGRAGYYDPRRTLTAVRSAQVLTRAAGAVLVLVMALEFFHLARPGDRLALFGFLTVGTALLGMWRWVLLRLSRRWPVPVRGPVVAVYGVGEDAALMARRLLRESGGITLVGFLAPGSADDMAVPPEQVLGEVDRLREIVNTHRVDTVVLASRRLDRADAMELAKRGHAMGLHVLQVPFTWGIVSPRLDFAALGNLQLIDLSEIRYPDPARAIKRAVDLLAVTLGGLALMPLMLGIAAAVRLTSPGPALFTAPRMGKGGRVFPFFKFRSMVDGANAMKDALRGENESDGLLFKLRDDPRVTPLGRVLRRWSLDELPQLLNVLRGDMNLVGPRPLPVEDLVNVDDDPEVAYWLELRHQVRPGITGLWQVRGRSELGFREMVQHDIYYIQNWSLWLDLKILLLTVPAVLRGRGAA